MTQASDLSDLVVEYLTAAPTSEFLNQDVAIIAAWEGRDNLLWRVSTNAREAILKLYLDAGQARSRRQFDGQQTFAHLGIAPRPIWYDRYPVGLARQVMVYEWAEGRPIEPTTNSHLMDLARAVAQVHSGDPSDVHRFSPNPLNLDYLWRVMQGSIQPSRRWLNEQGQPLLTLFEHLTDRTKTLIEAALPLWQSAPPTPVHGDLKLENCIQHLGTTVLLDWEMYGLGDPALDVANFLYLNRGELDQEMGATWLDAYLALLDQPNLAQRIGVYQRVLPVQSVCFLLDGLRDLPADLPDAAATLAFLATTLKACLIEAIDVIGTAETGTEEMDTDVADIDDVITVFFEHLQEK